MKKAILMTIGCVLLAGCTTTVDPTTKALMDMNLSKPKKVEEKRITIEVMSKEEKNYPMEVILNSDGTFTIPSDKIITRYELKIN